MFASWEVRWFCAGEPDSHAVALFPRFDWSAIDGRQDVYLRLPGVADLGIKQRQGWLEVKGRRLVIPGVQLAPAATGNLEQWIKWRCRGAELGALLKSPEGIDSLGIRVQKQRVQRKFHLGYKPEEVAIARRLDRGAYLELTRLEVQGQRWWSLGVEAFPDDSEVPKQVAALVSMLLEDTSIQLPEDRCQSYPAWLKQFGATDS
jgi:hypothetical protein